MFVSLGNMMMGRRFAFANPAPFPISIDIYVYSDIEEVAVQITDKGGTDSQFIFRAAEGKHEILAHAIFTQLVKSS